MRIQIPPIAPILVIPIIAIPLIACDATLPFRYALCGADLIPAPPTPTYEQSPDDPCLYILTSDPADLPTYEQVLAESECNALESSVCSFSGDAWQVGACNAGQYLFISFGGSFGGSTMYFDPLTRRLLGSTDTTDAVTADCGITTYRIARIECIDPVVTRSLCPFGPFSTLFR